jgi:hypothetical protein
VLRLVVIAAAAAILATATVSAVEARTPSGTSRGADVARPAPIFVAFGGRFGGFRSRSPYSRYSRYGYGYGRRSPSLLHRVVKTAIWLYVLHLFFTHGGLSIVLWVIIIGLVLSLARRRRRRYAYSSQSWR